jgi:transposase InsO family protein
MTFLLLTGAIQPELGRLDPADCERKGKSAGPSLPTGSTRIRCRTPKSSVVRRCKLCANPEGWLYLAVVLDLFTRKIVGWAMRDHMRAELTIAALTMAIQRQKPPPGLIHHSDRGSQYATANYRKVLDAAGMIQSMSRKGNCWDNAPMESCFGTIKTELVHQACYQTRDAARHDLFTYIEGRTPRRLIRCPQNRGKVKPVAAAQGCLAWAATGHTVEMNRNARYHCVTSAAGGMHGS